LVENEYKWLLDNSIKSTLFTFVNNANISMIIQGTLVHNNLCWTRIRCSTSMSTREKTYTITTKAKAYDELVEIEKQLDSKLGQILLDSTVDTLTKVRVEWETDDVKWALDFYNSLGVTIPILEAEVPRGYPRPELMDGLKKYVIHTVLKNDSRFGSRSFVDQATVSKLYTQYYRERQNE
jgi:hypothetical protein